MISIMSVPYGDGLTLRASGHANYAPRGQDTVCAGVSVLLHAYLDYLRGLMPHSGADASVEYEEREGYMMIRSTGFNGRDLEGFEVVKQGLRRLQSAFPQHVLFMCHGSDAETDSET